MRLCLLSEHTYPYHVGGVSTWTHALLQGLPEVEFVLVPLYAGTAPGPQRWSLPPNVSAVRPLRAPDTLTPRAIERWSHAAVAALPSVDLVHALTASVAGHLGRAARAERGTPLLVTEHGIGWHELAEGTGETETGYRPDTACRAQHVRHMKTLARDVYSAANRIAAVAHSTREKQEALGADPSRCTVIPNGVDLPSLAPPSTTDTAPHIGLVGRVTPLKDIFTFLRACAQVRRALPEARFSVLGPPADPAYAARCHALAHHLGLSDALTFIEDAREMGPWYERLDVVTLTSRSEAAPLALLEAMAHTRPIVATDVGDCRRLVHGPDDAYGPAGILCPPGAPRAIAQSLLALGSSPQMRSRYGWAGRQRVASFYHRPQMVDAYRRVYTGLVSSPRPASRSHA
jgi:glycosyltransferase involved in cell wall biosynthesis